MRIGIFGGTFDPIHTGHMILAQEALEQAALDKVIIMPAKVSPFKQQHETADGGHRLEMARLGARDNDFFQVSDFEMKLQDVSYTIDTLRAYRECTGAEDKIYFIMGTDAFLDIEKWYKAAELLHEFSFIVGERPGYKTSELTRLVKKLGGSAEIIRIQNRLIEISSTEIKERLMQGRCITYLVPKQVEEYIDARDIY